MAANTKLTGWELYRDVLKSPKYIVAPMVDQSELAWRQLSRRYGSQLIYSPMINAKMFTTQVHKTYRDNNFNITCGEEGSPTLDRPLIVQFCANDPDQLLEAAKMVEPHCDAVDINLGCPQDIAKKGKYGAFLQDDWELIYKLINILHVNLSIPVTAKFRVFPTLEKTIAYAQMLESAGAQILTCHGRLREQRGVNSGLADWSKIKAVKENIKVPVIANGNILYQEDIFKCLEETGADGVMSAEGQLYNPALFNGLTNDSNLGETKEERYMSDEEILKRQPRHCDLAIEYLDIVLSQKTPTAVSAVKGHLFKIMRPGLTREKDLRERLGKTRVNPKAPREGYEEYLKICNELKERMKRDEDAVAGKSLKELIEIDAATGIPVMPHWLVQPYFRPLPTPVTVTEKKKKKGSTITNTEETVVVDVPLKRGHEEVEVENIMAKEDNETVEVNGTGKRLKLDLDEGGVQSVVSKSVSVS